MKINRFFHIFIASFLLAAAALFACGQAPAETETRDADRAEDGFPLLAARDAGALEALWTELEAQSGAYEPFDDAVYLQLKTQGKRYKGKLLRVRGRLLRGVYVPIDAQTGYYDLWVLLPDAKRDPIRVLAKNAPGGFKPDDKLENAKPYAKDVQYRQEPFEAYAVYYRATAYDAGDDIYAAPTLVAYDFALGGRSSGAAPTAPRRRSSLVYKLAAVLALVPIWFFARRFVKALRNVRRTAPTPGANAAPLPDKLDTFPLLLAALLALAPSTARAHSPAPADDVDFWSAAVDAEPDAWTNASTAVRDGLFGQDRELALSALSRLTGLLSISVLKERGSDAFRATTLGAYASNRDRAPFFTPDAKEIVGYFVGEIQKLEIVELNEAEKERCGFERLYRVELSQTPGGVLVVYTPTVPAFTAPQPLADALDSARSARAAGYALRFGSESVGGSAAPVVLAPKLGWIPLGSPLGDAGLDVSSYEKAPVYKHDALETASDPQERRRVARSMRWTTDDVEPFYQTLAAVKRMPKGADDRAPLENVVDLFNRPEENQGRLTRLVGWARRVNTVLIDDPDVKAATGLERYYQLYVFTDDSQGHPLVLCVPELPKGLKPGGGKGYAPAVDFRGYFYKTWAYEKDAGAPAPSAVHDEDVSASDAAKWTRAPVLIGRVLRVDADEPAPEPPIPTKTILASFAILACAWIVLRNLAKRPVKAKR